MPHWKRRSICHIIRSACMNFAKLNVLFCRVFKFLNTTSIGSRNENAFQLFVVHGKCFLQSIHCRRCAAANPFFDSIAAIAAVFVPLCEHWPMLWRVSLKGNPEWTNEVLCDCMYCDAIWLGLYAIAVAAAAACASATSIAMAMAVSRTNTIARRVCLCAAGRKCCVGNPARLSC